MQPIWRAPTAECHPLPVGRAREVSVNVYTGRLVDLRIRTANRAEGVGLRDVGRGQDRRK